MAGTKKGGGKPPQNKKIPLPEAMPIFREIEHSNDRAAGIVAASFVENALAVALLAWLRPLDNGEQRSLFEGNDALLNTFSSKIQLADALGLIAAHGLADLRRLKRIRNLFAHRMEVRTFDNPEIVALCNALIYPGYIAWSQKQKEERNSRKRFEDTAHHLAARFDLAAKNPKRPQPPDIASYDAWQP